MRTRVVRERSSRTTYLEARLGHKERLDMGCLRMLEATRCRTLLVPRLVDNGDGYETLRYDVTGLTTLRELVRRDVLSHQKYERMLASVAEVVGSCQDAGVDSSSLLLESGRVMASFEGVLHFASVPLAGGAPSSRTTMLGLVRLLSDTHRLKFNLEEDEEIAHAVARFHDASDSFDVEAYCQLLGEEFGMVPQTLLRPHADADAAPGALCSDDFEEWEERPGPDVAVQFPEGHAAVPATVSLRDLRGGEAGSRGHAPDSRGSASAPRNEPAGSEQAAPGGADGEALESYEESPGETSIDAGNDAAYLLVRLDTEERYPLAADETLTLGRSGSCSVQLLGNPDISRRQASVLCEDEGCVLCDLGSANGTTVRGHDLGENESARVAFGEIFQLAGEPFSIVPNPGT